MGIQPIDLQTMYSQLSNVNRTLSAAQQVQLTQAMQQKSDIEKNLEESKKVQKTSGEQAEKVGEDGNNGQPFQGSFNSKSDKQKSEEKLADLKNLKNNYGKNGSPYLGTIIDITR